MKLFRYQLLFVMLWGSLFLGCQRPSCPLKIEYKEVIFEDISSLYQDEMKLIKAAFTSGFMDNLLSENKLCEMYINENRLMRCYKKDDFWLGERLTIAEKIAEPAPEVSIIEFNTRGKIYPLQKTFLLYITVKKEDDHRTYRCIFRNTEDQGWILCEIEKIIIY